MAAIPVTISLTNLLTFLSLLSPFFVSFFMLLFSIINNNITKGLIYLSGLLIVTFINYLLKNILKSTLPINASPLCKVLPPPFSVINSGETYVSPSLNTTVLAFTFSYLVYPMIINNDINPSLLVFLTMFLVINSSVEFMQKCVDFSGILFGIILGIICGILFYMMLHINGFEKLAYFTHIDSNAVKCGKPGKQKFKCVSYKKTTRPASS